MLALHRAKFLAWEPSTCISLAPTRDGQVIAVGRESNDIELYSVTDWTLLRRIPGSEDAALTCVTWAAGSAKGPDSRLFSAGLDGQIVEYDLTTLRSKSVSDAHGGAVWSLAREPRTATAEDASASFQERYAVGCDDGAIRIFTVEPGVVGMQYSKSLPRVEGRILSLAWHPAGNILVAGDSVGCIRCWDVRDNREILRITVGDGSGKEDVCVWSVAVLPDGTLVSGDSNGNTQFWDGAFGTRIQAFQQHGADVMCVAATPGGSMVFSAGVDHQIAAFQRVASLDLSEEAAAANPDLAETLRLATEQGQPWVYLTSKRPHSHDVRALCMLPVQPTTGATAGAEPPKCLMLSGGVDAQLFAYSALQFPKQHPIRVVKDPQRPRISVCMGSGAGPSGSRGVSTEPINGRSNGVATTSKPSLPRVGSLGRLAASSTSNALPRILCMQPRHVDIWRLGRPGTTVMGVAVNTPPLSSPRGGSQLNQNLPPNAAVPNGNGTAALDAATVAKSPDAAGVGSKRPRAEPHANGDVPAPIDGTANPLIPNEFDPLDLADAPKHLARIKSGRKGFLLSAALSPSGLLVAFSDTDKVRLYALDAETNDVRKRKVAAAVPAASQLAFTSDSRHLIAATPAGSITVIDVESGEIVRTFEEAAGAQADAERVATSLAAVAAPVTSLQCSADGQWLAAGGPRGVHLFDMEGLRYHGKLPAVEEGLAITAVSFNATGTEVALANSRNHVYIFDAETRKQTPWSRTVQSDPPKRLEEMPGIIHGISFNPLPGLQSMLLSTSSAFCHINLEKPLPAAEQDKKRRRRQGEAEAIASKRGTNLRVFVLDNPCLHMGFTSADSAVLLEKPWDEVLATMPPPAFRPVYGRE